ncbi:MAG: DUF4097 family beta strand repeat-containing protein [Chitinophagaceae bacterium]
MKKYVIALILGSSFLAANAQDASKEPYMTKSLASDAIQNVNVETTGGNISVAGADANPRVEVYVWASNGRDRNISKEEIKKRLDEDYELTVTSENHKLTATAKPKRNFSNWNNHGLSISFKVYVPQNVSSDLRTSGGNISLTTLTGTQDFTTSGGNLSIEHLKGHIKGRTSGGNINLNDLQDDIDLSTSGGNITAGKANGTIKLTTSGGSLVLKELQGSIRASTSGGNVSANEITGDLSAHTSGGNVRMDGLSCSLETSTSGGNIDVNFKSLGKYVKISNSGGHIDLQVPASQGMDLKLTADRVNATALSGFKGDIKKDRIEGSLNGGGVPVNVNGGSSINLTLK